ncbi:MAG: ChbG/HpnK family deacetylase [Clostridium sp.]|nr:ChbG/HpnK family deacetylase [Clostridium sp.]
MKLIINADDYGLSKSISDGIILGIREGYITSTSIMVNMTWAEYAIQKALEYNIDCIGLHINLTVGKPILKNDNLINNNGYFYYNKEQIENPKLTYQDAYNEIMAQVNAISNYSDGKLKIDHLDTHHHLMDNPNIKQAIVDIAQKLNLPIRKCNNVQNIKCPDFLYRNFTINNVSIDSIKQLIEKYKNDNVVVELMTHPGLMDEYTKTVTSYLNREKELLVLKESKKLGLFEGIDLISFREF